MWGRFGRGTQHYGATLDAIPLLDAFRRDPTDLHLLRIGYAGANSVRANIDARGHGAMCFMTDPDLLDYDPFTGDYGSAFFGQAWNAGACAVRHDQFGWLGFGCDVREDGQAVRIEPRDAFRQRVFLAPSGLWLTLEAGRFEHVAMDLSGDVVTVTLAAAEPHTSTARLIVEQPAAGLGPPAYHPTAPLPLVRRAWEGA